MIRCTMGRRVRRRARSAGVPVKLTTYAGMPHGYLTFPSVCRGAREALTEVIAEQQRALPSERVPPG